MVLNLHSRFDNKIVGCRVAVAHNYCSLQNRSDLVLDHMVHGCSYPDHNFRSLLDLDHNHLCHGMERRLCRDNGGLCHWVDPES